MYQKVSSSFPAIISISLLITFFTVCLGCMQHYFTLYMHADWWFTCILYSLYVFLLLCTISNILIFFIHFFSDSMLPCNMYLRSGLSDATFFFIGCGLIFLHCCIPAHHLQLAFFQHVCITLQFKWCKSNSFFIGSFLVQSLLFFFCSV